MATRRSRPSTTIDKRKKDKVTKLVREITKVGLNKSGVLLVGDVRKRLNIGVGRSGGKVTQRSKPGEAPRKDTNTLFKSINHRVEESGKDILLKIGANVPYAARLEFGFVGTDSRGRQINQAPRPFLRPAIIDNRKKIIKLIETAKAPRKA